MRSHFVNASILAAFALLTGGGAVAAPSVPKVVDVDLARLIRAAASDADRFAVEIAQPISSDRDGVWDESGGMATWRYSVRVPTAISLSFHARQLTLPSGAILRVGNGTTTFAYSRTAGADGLWSRITRGELLQFELQTPAAGRQAVHLEVDTLQAGYRALSSDTEDHPEYRRLHIQSVVAADTDCRQNYACLIDAHNAGPGKATVALTIGNVYQCTGTLVNNTSADNTPYILTARHCRNGLAIGPDGIIIFWNALSACGETLHSIYEGTQFVQYGATTVLEQEDAWLIRLTQPPVIDDAYFAGFDATGSAIQGGYTIHHGESNTKQIVNWFGQAASEEATVVALGNRYLSHFWLVVNSAGNFNGGASGAALFDQNDRVTGSLSLGRTDRDACPAPSPPAPNAQNAVARFTSLAGAWNSTQDQTSSTGSVTLKSLLDPGDTGQLVVDGAAMLPVVRMGPASNVAIIGNSSGLSWQAPGATSCMASGGLAGDGWAGAAPAVGSRSFIENVAGAVTYRMTCTYPDGHQSSAERSISWVLPAPQADLRADRAEVWTERPIKLTWSSNVSPCTIEGGSTPLTNLDSSGTTTVTEASPGKRTYSLKCGSGDRIATAPNPAGVEYFTPAVQLTPSSTDVHVGYALQLWWITAADSCIPSGGASDDDWANHQFSGGSNGTGFYTHAVGTFTYQLTCTAGPITVASNVVTVTIENDAPYLNFQMSDTQVVVGEPLDMSWKSNVFPCNPRFSIPFTDELLTLVSRSGTFEEGSVHYQARAPGSMTVTYFCTLLNGQEITSTPTTLTVLDAGQASVSTDLTRVTVGKSFFLNWAARNVTSCTASGGGADGTTWSGSPALPSGTISITATTTGTFTYTMDCIGLLQRNTYRSQATITVDPAPPPPSGGNGGGAGSGGGGGGGSFDALSAGVLGIIGMLAAWRRRSVAARRPGWRGPPPHVIICKRIAYSVISDVPRSATAAARSDPEPEHGLRARPGSASDRSGYRRLQGRSGPLHRARQRQARGRVATRTSGH
jgi:hypothetical protein